MRQLEKLTQKLWGLLKLKHFREILTPKRWWTGRVHHASITPCFRYSCISLCASASGPSLLISPCTSQPSLQMRAGRPHEKEECGESWPQTDKSQLEQAFLCYSTVPNLIYIRQTPLLSQKGIIVHGFSFISSHEQENSRWWKPEPVLLYFFWRQIQLSSPLVVCYDGTWSWGSI